MHFALDKIEIMYLKSELNCDKTETGRRQGRSRTYILLVLGIQYIHTKVIVGKFRFPFHIGQKKSK